MMMMMMIIDLLSLPNTHIYTVSTRPGVHVGVMLDTKGPEIRTGFLGSAKSVEYKKGSIVEILTDYSIPGDSTKYVCYVCM